MPDGARAAGHGWRASESGRVRKARPRANCKQNEKGTVMLITFKCRAAPDVVMLENLAQYLVGIVGNASLARRVLPWVATARPREVNAQRFEQERQFWRDWNRAQSQAEAEFQPSPRT